MVSDDTDHAFFVAQALLARPGSPQVFARRLAWSLRLWLLTLPAGIGFGTLRAILKLWIGFPPHASGVGSAGNGAAMRIAPIGAYFADDPEALTRFVGIATRVTHRDERARVGALAVARLVAWSISEELAERPSIERFLALLRACGEEDAEWSRVVDALGVAAARDAPVEALATQLGLERGVSGYVYHTVPVAVYAWFHHFGDFARALVAVLDCGGDTDTAGAIVGALCGAVVGGAGIPEDWVHGIADWPRGPDLLLELADRLAEAAGGASRGPVRYFWPGLLPRNAFFLLVVLLHGFRRLAPPY